jgi:NADH:ubiquinone oxidoreductase subunit 6 (subunit J)
MFPGLYLVAMFVTPFPVVILVSPSGSWPLTILAVIFLKIAAVGAIFVAVPHVVVLVGPVVVPPLIAVPIISIISTYRYWSYQHGTQKKCNQITRHLFSFTG